MGSREANSGAALFGYHFGSASDEIGFHTPDDSVPPTGPSILSQEDAHRMGNFFAHTPFWPEGNSVQPEAGRESLGQQLFGYYPLTEVHDISIQSPFSQNTLNPLTFMSQSQAEVMGAVSSHTPGGSHPSSGDIFGPAIQHNSLHIPSENALMNTSSANIIEHGMIPSLGREDSNSNQSPQSNAITPSPTISTGPKPFMHRTSGANQIQSTNIYDMPTSPQARMQSLPNDGGRYRAPVQFGTDDRFRPNGFSGPEAVELNRDYDRKINDTMKFFQPSPIIETPQSASPTARRGLQNSIDAVKMESEDVQNGSGGSVENDRSAKRLKIETVSEQRSNEAPKRRNKVVSSDIAISPAKRKKAANNQSRQNLTDEQKRSNHIKSEQKRRDIIKQGFKDLHFLVPALQKSSRSKAEQLQETVIWLRSLVEGNEELKRKLKDCGVSPATLKELVS